MPHRSLAREAKRLIDRIAETPRAAGSEGAAEVGGLSRDVQARPDEQPVQRPVALEASADPAQDGHLRVGPLDAGRPLGR